MANYSAKERIIATALSKTPRIKAFIKNIYIIINSLIHKKNYKFACSKKIHNGITTIEPDTKNAETFFGYYDKSPENSKGLVLFCQTAHPTSKKPSSKDAISIMTYDPITKTTKHIAESRAYNWQQGCRALWLNDDIIAYNDFRDNNYCSILFSTKQNKEIQTINYPIQDSFKDEYFLSINYRRLMSLQPDYGYRNLEKLTNSQLKETEQDGIWKCHFCNGEPALILSLTDIKNFEHKTEFDDALHMVNHIMISPDGTKFIFIHRWYVGKRRNDRLLLFENNQLHLIADEQMVSHMCWLSNNQLFGYFKHNSKDGFYFINLESMSISPCSNLNSFNLGDGHPSTSHNRIVSDSYPDKSRMQHILLSDISSGTTEQLLEVYQSVRYKGECRCDLHPRLSKDGQRIWFDTIYSGKRRLSYIDL